MYACICAAVTDAAVADAIREGARTEEDLGRVTGAGVACGSCHDHLCDMIQTVTGDCPGAVTTAS